MVLLVDPFSCIICCTDNNGQIGGKEIKSENEKTEEEIRKETELIYKISGEIKGIYNPFDKDLLGNCVNALNSDRIIINRNSKPKI